MDNTGRLNELLTSSALKNPDATALVFEGQKLIYSELNSASDTICRLLTKQNIGSGDRIAIYTFKSLEFVTAIFGTLKSGAAYLPIDPSAPIERNSFIIEDCEVKAIILNKDFYPEFKNSFSLVSSLSPDLLLLKSKNKNRKKSSSELAYILYTSGSTGRPKGVMFSHSSALQFVNWSSAIFQPDKNDTFSSHAPFHFDLSIFDLFVSIKHQSKLILITEETARQPLLLAKLISDQKISIWYSTPTILNLLATYGKMQNFNYDSLRLILFAGEIFPLDQFKRLKSNWPSKVYFNLYGPTETNVCTYFKIPDDLSILRTGSFPIGKCCEHYNFRILTANENSTGELLISGKGILLGYWSAENNNSESFFIDEKNITWYKTGDLVEKDQEENLIFKGRIDRMVKRNGYRIELAEIELALSKHPAIIECAVLANSNPETGITITAFVCCTSAKEESIIKMKEYCMKHLPVYMIPNTFIFLKTLPQTASNKTDLQQLKQLL